ncbi:hypothetical protein ON003_07990 [Janibacter hoylei]|uniref:hypothetical protein n=1 Tax=Janibacter hoylei TaxID=364298 RepID=UPI002237EDDB|nr:hypothetical protein [Janibacter hoylei]MCW4601534.1 hypothetical protein [Janibacter hoylei]
MGGATGGRDEGVDALPSLRSGRCERGSVATGLGGAHPLAEGEERGHDLRLFPRDDVDEVRGDGRLAQGLDRGGQVGVALVLGRGHPPGAGGDEVGQGCCVDVGDGLAQLHGLRRARRRCG